MYFDFKVSKSLVWSAWEIRLAGASRPIERVNADKTDVVLFIYCSVDGYRQDLQDDAD